MVAASATFCNVELLTCYVSAR